tara:strand:- start:804 stop:1184 length:381 start_codon:yes stop_codon:yes gene_type:complete
MSVINGSAAFINLNEHEMYQGKSTEKFSLTVTLDDASIAQLESQGVKLRQYSPDGGEPQSQRKFASKFDVPVYEANGDEFMGNVTRGSHVRVQYSLGQEHPVHGITPYLDKIKVLELASGDTDEDF